MSAIGDIRYVRFRVGDLKVQHQFLEDFGCAVERTDGLLLARGTDAGPYVYIAEPGEPMFCALGFEATELGTLHALATMDGVAIQDNPFPGGGALVRLHDPDGHCVEVVYGVKPRPALPVRSRLPLNTGEQRRRLGRRVPHLATGPIVKRLGHVVLSVSNFRESEAWYKTRFGLVTSDEIKLGDTTLGAFLRCDRGADYVDHHTLFLIESPQAGLHHCAFEVADWDTLMKSHYDLERAGYTHSYGVGKHILGSQVFDYWKDPSGFLLEHFTDGDLLNLASGSSVRTLDELLGSLWGPDGSPGD